VKDEGGGTKNGLALWTATSCYREKDKSEQRVQCDLLRTP